MYKHRFSILEAPTQQDTEFNIKRKVPIKSVVKANFLVMISLKDLNLIFNHNSKQLKICEFLALKKSRIKLSELELIFKSSS